MKSQLGLVLLVFCGLYLLVGCTSPKIIESKPAILIVVRVAGGGAPTAQQADAVQRAITPAVMQAGLQFASTLDLADFVLTVTISPDPANPGKGHIAINGIERQMQRPGSKDANTAWERVRNLEQWGLSHSAPDF